MPDDYRWDNLGRDLIALADSLGIDQFVAGGASMGAATALHAAVHAPRRVIALVLMLAPTAYETRDEQADLYRAAAVLVERLGMEAYLQQLSNLPAPGILADFADRFSPVPQVSEQLLPSVLRGAASSDLPPQEAVRRVTAPTLLLPWISDDGHPLSTSERLLELLPKSRFTSPTTCVTSRPGPTGSTRSSTAQTSAPRVSGLFRHAEAVGVEAQRRGGVRPGRGRSRRGRSWMPPNLPRGCSAMNDCIAARAPSVNGWPARS